MEYFLYNFILFSSLYSLGKAIEYIVWHKVILKYE